MAVNKDNVKDTRKTVLDMIRSLEYDKEKARNLEVPECLKNDWNKFCDMHEDPVSDISLREMRMGDLDTLRNASWIDLDLSNIVLWALGCSLEELGLENKGV